ncbi:MAG: Flagellar sensor histidine kinase fleS [Nitrospira sp.]|nr:MAG: Flagellar sensor histidine kinase fleS [Nitrospira sp.]
MTPSTALHPAERDLLQEAFHTFDQAAHTLQRSYATLTDRIEQMDVELSQSNAALRQQLQDNEAMRAHLSGILDSLTTGVLVVDLGGRVTRVNAAATRLLGRSDDALRGQFAQALLDGLQLTVSEQPQRHEAHVLTIAQRSLEASSEQSSGQLILIHDVTQMCRLEERLQRQHRLVAMGEMVGRIAHEIRNPLGSIELFASMLRRDLQEQPASLAYAEQISQAVHGLDRLLSNLLIYTQPERSARGWQTVETLILDALTLAAHAITKTPVDIRLDLDPRIPAMWCNEGQFKQVVLNLILNAVQAMPTGGILTLKLEQADSSSFGGRAICLTIADNGPGIDPAHRSRIFDPFFTTKDEGTGLGLAIVHAIIDAHHGRIDVESQLGEGTTFTILLPHPAEPSIAGAESLEWPGGHERPASDSKSAVHVETMEERAHE